VRKAAWRDQIGNCRKLLVLAGSLALLAACAETAAPDTAADKAAIRAVSIAWKNAYNAGDAAAVAALYAEDALLSAPGERPLVGNPAISEYFAKKVAEFSAAGLTVADAPMGDVGASGDLGFQWETYRVTDRSGAVVDAGKLLTLFGRRKGKWMIIGDTWNSNAVPGVPAARATAAVPAPSN
jgi:uncharacterized protein (TIGR02246 family)